MRGCVCRVVCVRPQPWRVGLTMGAGGGMGCGGGGSGGGGRGGCYAPLQQRDGGLGHALLVEHLAHPVPANVLVSEDLRQCGS
jgi:hypothetical protein